MKVKKKGTHKKAHAPRAPHEIETAPEERVGVQMKKVRFYKRPKLMIFLAAMVLLTVGAFAYFSKEEEVEYEFIEAERSDLVQEVSITGRVVPRESVDLVFEVSGKVKEIFVEEGNSVKKGQELITLDNADVSAQLRQAKAGLSSSYASYNQYKAALDTQEVNLAEMKKGTRPEEIQIAQTAVYNTEQIWNDTKRNLENVKTRAEVDLNNIYNSTANALSSAVNTGKTALYTLTDIQYAHFSGSDQESYRISNAKRDAILVLLGGRDGGRWTTISISTQNGGVYGEVQDVILNPDREVIDVLINSVIAALQQVKFALNSIPISHKLSVTEKTNLDSAKISIDTEITTISGKQQSIAVQKATNESMISAAESEITMAKNNLASALDQLDLKIAGYTEEQIKAQEAIVRQARATLNSQNALILQAQANVENVQARFNKTILTAPIDGVITKMNAKVGEMVLPTSPNFSESLVTLISEVNFEIEANMPEVDVAKVEVGDNSRVTLDAYGDEVEFKAIVMRIDPAETIIEGIPTYETILQFTKEDERIKSGMTANLDILTAEKENVIAIPQRAVATKEGKKMVKVLTVEPDPKNPKKTIEVVTEVEVITGLRGSDGRIEILEGIEEGDKVVIMIKE